MNLEEKEKVLEVVAGSQAYGTNTPESDLDIRGLFYRPNDGLFKAADDERDNKSDIVFYNLEKYFLLAQGNNPNILEIIYTDPQHQRYVTDAARELIENRSIFLSANCYQSYSGYAHAQIVRMRNHHKWINNPQEVDPPKIIDYCKMIKARTGSVTSVMPEHWANEWYAVEVNRHIYRLYESTINSKIKPGIFTNVPGQIRSNDPIDMKDFVGTLMVDRQNFEKAHDDWKSYWEWKNNRNEKRGELEEKHGYDSKFAMHAIRLLRQGIEILKEGNIQVYRPDREELMDIRNGKWTYDEVLEHANELKDEAKSLYDNKQYVVPEKCDKNKINELFKKVVFMSGGPKP